MVEYTAREYLIEIEGYDPKESMFDEQVVSFHEHAGGPGTEEELRRAYATWDKENCEIETLHWRNHHRNPDDERPRSGLNWEEWGNGESDDWY